MCSVQWFAPKLTCSFTYFSIGSSSCPYAAPQGYAFSGERSSTVLALSSYFDGSPAMPPKAELDLTDRQVKNFMKKAHEIVKSNFSPKEHLPPAIYRFLKPIVDSTCQGWYAATMMPWLHGRLYEWCGTRRPRRLSLWFSKLGTRKPPLCRLRRNIRYL